MAITRAQSLLLRAVLVAAAAAIAIAGGASRTLPAAAQTDSRPNVILILVDDMGWSDIGSYGSKIPTPNLDALAARGVRFTQFYSTPRCCSPTRASLLTGLYPHQAGMGHLDNVIRAGSSGTTGRLTDRSVTIAKVLRDAGYFTAMSGKWHLGQQNGSPPWQRGFERVLSLRAGDGRFNGSPPGGPNSNLYLGMNWAALGSTPFRRFKHFTHEGGSPRRSSCTGPGALLPWRRRALARSGFLSRPQSCA
jgi:Sulfatase